MKKILFLLILLSSIQTLYCSRKRLTLRIPVTKSSFTICRTTNPANVLKSIKKNTKHLIIEIDRMITNRNLGSTHDRRNAQSQISILTTLNYVLYFAVSKKLNLEKITINSGVKLEIYKEDFFERVVRNLEEINIEVNY